MSAPSIKNVKQLLLPLAAASCVAALGLTGCSGAEPEPPVDPPETAVTETEEAPPEEEETPVGLEGTDFGNLAWVFRPGGSVPETIQIELVDGKALDGMVSYEVGEVVLSELTGDERMDAAVQITRLDGNAIDEQWYLWVATDEGPVQSTLPVARMARCGTVTHSVTAVDGGVQIHETRRSVADQNVPCSDMGTDERTRTVSAIEARNAGEWWPVQTAPFNAFGGLCPGTTHLDAYENDVTMYPVPDLEAGAPLALDDAPAVFEIEAWPIYGEPFPGWVLVGAKHGTHLGCAWAERQ